MMKRIGSSVLLVSFLVAGCSNTSQADLERARAAGASAEAQKQVQASLAAEVQRLQDTASKAAATPSPGPVAAPGPAPAAQAAMTSCGENISVGGSTSCAFGQSVAQSYLYYGNGGTAVVQAYSPVTGQTYSMKCVSGIPVVCRGGNDAVVYIR